MRTFLLILALAGPSAALADIVVPTRTIRAKEIIAPTDLVTKEQDVPGAVETPDILVGQEARVALYPGRPIRAGDFGPPALVDRNDLVVLVFTASLCQSLPKDAHWGVGLLATGSE